MKNRSFLARKLALFYNDIQQKRTGLMCLQTDLEFNQNKIKELNKKFDIEMFHTQLRGGKDFAAENLKRFYYEANDLKKWKKKRIKPNDLIRKAAQNTNETIFTKYGFAPENIEKRSLNPKDGKYFEEIYDFVRFRKYYNNQIRNEKYNEKLDKRKKTLRRPLNLAEKVLVLAERIRKKDAPGRLYKSSTENMSFLIETEFLLFVKEKN